MATRQIIDLSIEVHKDLKVYPGVSRPLIYEVQNHKEFAVSMETIPHGVSELAAHSIIITGDHVGTHIDSWYHFNPDAPSVEGIPLEYCFGDGVVLDLSHKGPGAEITVDDVRNALSKIDYQLKPLDIALIRTDAAKLIETDAYLTDHPGMTKEATRWLIDQGIKVMGIDAIGFDIPVSRMFELKKFWESHRVMREAEYYHLENLCNLDKIPVSYGFQVAVFPLKLRGASASPVRAVAIIENSE